MTKYENKIVAFLDILGFKQRVFQSKAGAEKVIEDISDSISHAVNEIKTDGPHSIVIRLFSDCFCISCEHKDLALMTRELCYLQLFLAMRRIFVRGAVTEGPHFENENIIFSEGLIRAYELQDSARYPRIIVDKDIAITMMEESCPVSGYAISEYLAIAPDGCHFLDYLQMLTEEGIEGMMDDLLKDQRNAIIEEIKANISNPGVLEKYRWLAEYHNVKCSQFYRPEDYRINVSDGLCIPNDLFPSFRLGSLDFSNDKPGKCDKPNESKE